MSKDIRGEKVPLRQRENHVYKRAYELAASGLHISPITVVSALVKEGYPEAADLLNSDIVRADLRQVCARHWRGAAPEAKPSPGSDPLGLKGRRVSE
jgi:hypothetical protein